MPTNKEKREKVLAHFNFKDLFFLFVDLYSNKKMSCQDVSEFIQKETGVKYSTQYIRNLIKMSGKMRTRQEAYELLKLGSDYKSPIITKINNKPISLAKRFRVFERNKFRCPFCGCKEDLHLYNIHENYEFGKNNDFNLTVACLECSKKMNLIFADNPEQDEEVKQLFKQS
jgi:hypothetical protein